MRLLLKRLMVLAGVLLGTVCGAADKHPRAAGKPAVVKEDPGAAHRAEWVKRLATGENCLPDKPSTRKGVCIAAAAYPKARRTAPPPQAVRLWGMTLRERFKGSQRLQQSINLAAIELVPTEGGGMRVAFFELWPASEEDIDELSTACEEFDNHYFRRQEKLPEPRWEGRVLTGLGQDEGPRRVDLQPTAHGYSGGTPPLEVRAFAQGWMVVAEEQDAKAGEETHVLGVFVPLPERP